MNAEMADKFKWLSTNLPHFFYNQKKQKWEGNSDLLETFLAILEDEKFLEELKASLKHCRFQKHLDECSEKIKAWPDWKRNLLGKICR